MFWKEKLVEQPNQSTYCEIKPMFIHRLFFSPFVRDPTLFDHWMTFACWLLMSSFSTPHEHTYLVPQATLSDGMAMSMLVQVKEGLYYDCYPTYVFLSLAIEVFGCLHQLVNNFLHQCANMEWTAKGIESLFFYQFCVHFIDKECKWHYKERMLPPFRKGLQGRVLLSLELYGA